MNPSYDPHDAVAYPVFANVHTHPDTLAVLGRLHGLAPAPVARCRVLEVGCNDGANLIPMAYALPGSELVGFDLAGAPVARGQQRVRKLGLTNIRLFQANILDVGEELGTFDYIIAHGVYAWVPVAVRDRLLGLCQERLAPDGVVFVSYNALPGGHLRHLVQDVLRSGIPAGEEDTVEGVSQAVEFFKFVTACQPPADPLRPFLEKQVAELERRRPQALFHDELCAAEEPIAFAAFAAHAAKHGLQYLSEAVLPPPNDPCYQPQVMAVVHALAAGDAIAGENLLDVVRVRMYRETLLCHADRAIGRDVSVEAFGGLRLATQAVSAPGEGPDARVYSLPGNLQMESRDPTTMLVMDHLAEAWPESVPFADVAALLEAHRIALDAPLYTLLLRLVVARMIDLHAWAAPVSRLIAERPRASAISREEAAVQTRVVTLLHTTLSLPDPLVRALLRLLDGTRDRAALVEALARQFPEVPAATLVDGIEPSLRLLHRTGVLLAEELA